MEEKEIILNVADKKKIRCLTCKKGMHNFLAMYCLAYDLKPNDVYYENADCPNYEPIGGDQ